MDDLARDLRTRVALVRGRSAQQANEFLNSAVECRRQYLDCYAEDLSVGGPPFANWRQFQERAVETYAAQVGEVTLETVRGILGLTGRQFDPANPRDGMACMPRQRDFFRIFLEDQGWLGNDVIYDQCAVFGGYAIMDVIGRGRYAGVRIEYDQQVAWVFPNDRVGSGWAYTVEPVCVNLVTGEEFLAYRSPPNAYHCTPN